MKLKMEKIISYSKSFIKQMELEDMVLLKTCLLAMGVVLGTCVPKRYKKITVIGGIFVFIITYTPIMCKLVRGYMDHKTES